MRPVAGPAWTDRAPATARRSSSSWSGSAAVEQQEPDRLAGGQPRRARAAPAWTPRSTCRSACPADVLRRFDIVGFDPRGVGRSSPVKCIPTPTWTPAGYDPDPGSRAAVRRLPGRSTAEAAAGCGGQVRRQTAALRHRAGGPGHGRGPAPPSATTSSPTGLLVRHPARRDLRPAVPQRGPGAGARRRGGPESRARSPGRGPGKGLRAGVRRVRRWCRPTPAAARSRRTPGPWCGRWPGRARRRPAGRSRPAQGDRRAGPARGHLRAVHEAGWPQLERRSPTRTTATPAASSSSPTVRRAGRRRAHTATCSTPTRRQLRRPRSGAGGDDPPGRSQLAGQVPAVRRLLAIGMVGCVQWAAPRHPYPRTAVGAPPIVVVGTTNDPATPYARPGCWRRRWRPAGC